MFPPQTMNASAVDLLTVEFDLREATWSRNPNVRRLQELGQWAVAMAE